MIQIDHLEVRHGDVCAVDDLTLRVPEGALLGLLGPNGAGKTTTISCIAGLQTPTRGRVRVGEVDVTRDPEAARPLLGFVPQTLALFPTLSVLENLRVFAGLFGLRGARRRERVAWALALAQLEVKARARVEQLSGGMKRRLNLVCALLHDPQIIICDEPTTGVDPQSRNHLFKTIRRLNAQGRTVVYTTHYMEEVEALCSHVAIMDQGRLVVHDRLDALLGEGGGPRRFSLRVAPTLDEARLRTLLEAGGVGVEALARAPRSLEDVFLELTGHALRDDA